MLAKLATLLSAVYGLVLCEFNGKDSCFMLDYITMHRARITDINVTNQVFHLPNEESPTRTIFSLCKDLGPDLKARCGVGSEANVTMIFLVDDACVAHRRSDQVVTSHIYKEANHLTIEVLYPKKREQMEKEDSEEFDLVTLRFDLSDQDEHHFGHKCEARSYDPLLKDYSLSGYVYTMWLPNSKKGIIDSSKKNFTSHTNFNPVETALSWSIHCFFAYGMLYHNHKTRNFFGLRPFNLYFVPMPIISWIDTALNQTTKQYRSEFDWLITSVNILSPFVLG